MKREHFCYGTTPAGVVVFTRDVGGCVQLFDSGRIVREIDRRGCLSAKVGHSPHDKDAFICYWTERNGTVEFARDINKNVQLFSKTDAEASAKIHGCLIDQVGFVGISKDGIPVTAP